MQASDRSLSSLMLFDPDEDMLVQYFFTDKTTDSASQLKRLGIAKNPFISDSRIYLVALTWQEKLLCLSFERSRKLH